MKLRLNRKNPAGRASSLSQLTSNVCEDRLEACPAGSIGLGLLLLAACLHASPLFAAEEDGFVPLFNGRDLSNWTDVNVAPETFTVRDGIIVSTGVPTGVMRTKRMKPQGEWNHYRDESRDGVVTLAVNGKVVSGGSDCVPRKGYLCLESEGSECHFRNVRIKELPSSNAPVSQVADEDQGFVSLYTGLDLRGWKQEPEHKGHWQPKDWVLAYDGKGEGSGKNALD